MSVDREQVRRDAENRYGNPWARIARYEELVEHLDSELEQVKRKCLISETNYGYASDRLEQAERDAKQRQQQLSEVVRGAAYERERANAAEDRAERAEWERDELEQDRDAHVDRADAAEKRAAKAEAVIQNHEKTEQTSDAEAQLVVVPALVEDGQAFLKAYIDASVSDEEGLLAAVDQREWRSLWQAVDTAAQKFGKALAALDSA